MRELDTTNIGRAFVQGMHANASPEQTQRHLAPVTRPIEIFSSTNKLQPGRALCHALSVGQGHAIFHLRQAPERADG